MTPPLTPPNEAVSAAFSAELAHLFPGSMDPGPVNLAAHKNTQKNKVVSFIHLSFKWMFNIRIQQQVHQIIELCILLINFVCFPLLLFER